MVRLETAIQDLLLKHTSESKMQQHLSKTKKLLDSSSQMVDAVDQLSDNLKKNVKKGLGGGITGWVSGKVAGSTTKLVVGGSASIISSSLQMVASMIPDASDPKYHTTDEEISKLIDTFILPKDKDELFETLQWVSGLLSTSNSPFGEKTIVSFKNAHTRIYNQFCIVAKDDDVMMKLAQQYAPKKKFGFF